MAVTDRMYHDKNLYIMHNNGARNLMIEEGIKAGARWILPFDGNCFLTKAAWQEMMAVLEVNSNDSKYFYVPMARITDNALLIDDSFQ